MKELGKFVISSVDGDSSKKEQKGSINNPYTIDEYEQLHDQNLWEGGYVETLGQVAQEVAVANCDSGYLYSEQDSNEEDRDFTNRKKWAGWSRYDDNCLDLCKQILKNYGLKSYGSPSTAIQIACYKEKLFSYGSNNTSNEAFDQAIKVIDKHIDAGRPIIVGVFYPGYKHQETDGTTHFVVITGRINGCYRFMDCATGDINKGCSSKNIFSVDYAGRKINGYSAYYGIGNPFVLTQIRPNMPKL